MKDEIIAKALEILGEHFDEVLIVVASRPDGRSEPGEFAVEFSGGAHCAIGLAKRAEWSLLNGAIILPSEENP